jgi:hypothetical protein
MHASLLIRFAAVLTVPGCLLVVASPARKPEKVLVDEVIHHPPPRGFLRSPPASRRSSHGQNVVRNEFTEETIR